ncbi:MAG: hypothetical protein P8076_04465 [Gammaproteobacteria bacterium]
MAHLDFWQSAAWCENGFDHPYEGEAMFGTQWFRVVVSRALTVPDAAST